jgi:hypothetical protein
MATTAEKKKEAGENPTATQQAGSALHSVADSATSAVGSGMESLAGTIRDHTPHEGMIGTASNAVADTLESGGRYLKEHTPAEMFNDVTDLIRRNPLTCVMVGLGVGFLLARLTKR